MSENKLGNCRRCGLTCKSKFRICRNCQGELHRLKHDLNFLERFNNEKFLQEQFDETDFYRK